MTHDGRTLDSNGPKKPGSLRERIYTELRLRLQRCEFGPEDRLVDVDVAARYGTSRMPVREALLQLVNDGYLIGTTRGFAVPILTLEDVRDIFEVRKLLEPRAAAHAARDTTDRADLTLTRAIEEARSAFAGGDVERLIMANIDFRSGWLSCVHNKRLATTIARFVDHVQTVRLETLRRDGTRQVVIDGLEDLYAAFMKRDPIDAGDRMAVFVASAEQAYFAARRGAADPRASNASAAEEQWTGRPRLRRISA
jgi:DNA-binding GntR family transcriptional regulator